MSRLSYLLLCNKTVDEYCLLFMTCYVKESCLKTVFFSGEKYDKAIDLYTKAIELCPSEATYYGNRSFAYLKTELYGAALDDASKSIELDRNFLKVSNEVWVHFSGLNFAVDLVSRCGSCLLLNSF